MQFSSGRAEPDSTRSFPPGVCDWSKTGVSQTHRRALASFGPSPKNLVFDVTK